VKVGVWVKGKGMEISATLWAMWLRKDWYLLDMLSRTDRNGNNIYRHASLRHL